MVKPAALSPAHRIALDGVLCALAVIGRWAMGALPNVQPVTVILILIAVYIGLWDSIACTIVVVTVTNMIMGVGIWSLYQMLVWAAIAVVSGLLLRKKHHPVIMLVWCALMGYVYGALISVFSYKTVAVSGGSGGWLVYWLSGLTVDSFHALGNAVFVWFLQPLLERLIKPRKSTQ